MCLISVYFIRGTWSMNFAMRKKLYTYIETDNKNVSILRICTYSGKQLTLFFN